jgi:chromosome segregation ATPase
MTHNPPTNQQLDEYEAAARNAARIGSGIDPAAVLELAAALRDSRTEVEKLARWHREDETALAEMRGTIEQVREKHKAGLRRADEINNELMEEVQRYAEGKERPVLWSVYNAMHLRAATAEARIEQLQREHATWRKLGRRNLERANEEHAAVLGRIRETVRRLAAHAAGFGDVLDDSDRGPWAKTVGADIAELIDVLSDAPAAVAAVAETGQ